MPPITDYLPTLVLFLVTTFFAGMISAMTVDLWKTIKTKVKVWRTPPQAPPESETDT